MKAKVIGKELNREYDPEAVDIKVEHQIGDGGDYEELTITVLEEEAVEFKVGAEVSLLVNT